MKLLYEDRTVGSTETQKAMVIHSVKSRFGDIFGFILAWIPYALLVSRFWWVCDDAFISFRYSRNLAAGNGLRYNLGSHVPIEGYSNFLWVVICAAFEYLRVNVAFWSLLLSFVCGTTLLYLVLSTLRHRYGLNLILSCTATIFLGCSPPFVIWSTSGLETMAFALLLFVTSERLILRREGIAPIGAGIAGFALALMRVEGIYWAALLVPIAIFSRQFASQKFCRDILIYLSIVVIGYATYWVSRYAYYQLPFPNVAYVKMSLSIATLERGLNYVVVQFLTVLPLFVIVPGFVAAIRKGRLPTGLPVAIIPIAMIAYCIMVGGDFMPMSRFLVPGLAFNTILFGWLLKDIWGQSATRKILATALGVSVIGIGLLPAWNIHIVPDAVRERFHFRHNRKDYFSEYDAWVSEKIRTQIWGEKGKALKAYAKPGDSVVLLGIGAAGYYSDLFVYDRCGLVNHKVASHKIEERSLKSPGHDKLVPTKFFFNERPTLIITRVVTGQQLHFMISQMSKGMLPEYYVVDFMAMPEKNTNGVPDTPMYLLVSRRIKENADAKVAWQKVFNDLAKIPK